MTEKPALQALLARLPAVDELLLEAEKRGLMPRLPRALLLEEIRKKLAFFKQEILAGRRQGVDDCLPASELFWDDVVGRVEAYLEPFLRPVINATGVVIHTNLGRSPLPEVALEQIAAVARGYSNLEYDLARGHRSIRYANVEELLCRLSGAEAAMVVNNNAGAVLLALSALAAGREVVVSRGELVEIGGAFRVPEIVVQGGATLREVGATNRTHLRDYENAITEDTALLLKVHTSNYRQLGFTAQPAIADLVALGRCHGLPVVEDLGSGNLIDLKPFGLDDEPTLPEVIKSGVDLATCSGDKLLGGPQAGIIVGRRELVEKLRTHPLNRALRIDKLTLAGLEAVLKCFLNPMTLVNQVPTLRMLTYKEAELKKKAQRLRRVLRRVAGIRADQLEIELKAGTSRAGGGALPMVDLPTWLLALRISGRNPAAMERQLRLRRPPVVARVADNSLIFDTRTLFEDDFAELGRACVELLENTTGG